MVTVRPGHDQFVLDQLLVREPSSVEDEPSEWDYPKLINNLRMITRRGGVSQRVPKPTLRASASPIST